MKKKKLLQIQSVSPVFVDSGELTGETHDFFVSFITKLSDILKKSKAAQNETASDLSTEKKSLSIEFDNNQWDVLEKYYNDKDKVYANITFNELTDKITKSLNDIQQNRIINIDKDAIKSQKISIKKESLKYQTLENLDKVSDKKEMLAAFENKLFPSIKDSVLKGIVELIGEKFILENLIYNKDLTELEIKNRIEQIPKTVGIVRENERIVSKHEPISGMIKLKLDSYKKVQAETVGIQDIAKQYLGRLLLALVIIVIMYVFLYYFRKKIFYNNSKILLIVSVIIMECFFAYLSMQIKLNYPTTTTRVCACCGNAHYDFI
jgi:hypothetical protein